MPCPRQSPPRRSTTVEGWERYKTGIFVFIMLSPLRRPGRGASAGKFLPLIGQVRPVPSGVTTTLPGRPEQARPAGDGPSASLVPLLLTLHRRQFKSKLQSEPRPAHPRSLSPMDIAHRFRGGRPVAPLIFYHALSFERSFSGAWTRSRASGLGVPEPPPDTP